MPELTINSNPSGGEVQFDGRIIGITPITITIAEKPEPPSYTLAFTESFDSVGAPSMTLNFMESFDG